MKIVSSMLSFARKLRYSIPLAFLILVALYMVFGRSAATTATTYTVARGTVTEVVSVTGRVKATNSALMSFNRTGTIEKFYREVGEKVVEGDLIMALENKAELASLQEARATLAELTRGTRSEELAIQQFETGRAQNSYSNARDVLLSELQAAYVSADDAIHNKVDVLFSNPRSPNPEINPAFTLSNGTYEFRVALNKDRIIAEEVLTRWSKRLSSAVLENTNANTLIDDTQKDLEWLKNFVSRISVAVNSMQPVGSLTQTTIDGYRASISSARTALSSTISGLLTAESTYITALGNRNVQAESLTLKQNGATPEQILVQEARVGNALANLEKTYIRAPFDGVLVRRDGDIGQTVTPTDTVVLVINPEKYLVEVNIPEVDIGRISIGNSVKITLDAYPNKNFTGTVTYIEPGEVVVDNVVRYKIRVTFDENYPELKTGLTANLDIETQKKSEVVVIPLAAVSEKNREFYVQKIDGAEQVETKIVLGLRGVDGTVEVVNGLTVGDVVEVSGLKAK